MHKNGLSLGSLSSQSSIEPLENRQLLAATLAPNGTLSIVETANTDQTILITRTGINLDVNVNGLTTGTFPMSSILRIVVTTGNGNDAIIVAPASRDMSVSMDVYSRGGDDRILTAAGNDKIVGGAGVDAIFAGGGDDRIYGDYETPTERALDTNWPYADDLNGEAGFDRALDLDTLDLWTPGTQSTSGGTLVVAGNVAPAFTVVGGDGLDPLTVRQWYNFGTLGSTGVLTGAGQTIYFVTPFAAPGLKSDVATFSKAYAIPFSSSQISIVNVGGTAANEPSWGSATSAQVQWMHAMAPGAKIVVVQAATDLGPDVSAAIREAIIRSEDRGGGVVYFGFTATSTTLSKDIPGLIQSAQRTTFIAPTGDTPNFVSYLARLNTVIAVGGSSGSVDIDTNTFGETALATSGAGVTAVKPQGWQSDLGQTRRVAPDVVFHADADNPYAFYSSSPYYDESDQTFSAGWSSAGGTSFAGAQWAALIALANQQRAKRGLARLGPAAAAALYTVNRARGYGAFNDITTGLAGTAAAAAGFDVATGIGSPNARRLINAMASVQPFYIAGNFKWKGTFYKRPTAPSLGALERDPLLGEPRGGVGTVSGGDRIHLTFKAIPNTFAPSTAALKDVIRTDTAGLYRAAGGRIYGYGVAVIHDEDLLAITAPDAPWATVRFRIRFEGTITRIDSTHERLDLKWYAVTPVGLREIPSNPYARQNMINAGINAYEGTWFGGSLKTTVVSLSSRFTVPRNSSVVWPMDEYEGSSGSRDNARRNASIISTEGTPQVHTLHSGSDVDWVQFVLGTASRVIIETNGVSGGDTILGLYDEFGTRLARNDDSGIGAYSRISADLEPGRYFVRVSQYARYASGIREYTIAVRAGDPLPPSPVAFKNSVLTVRGTEDDDTILLSVSERDIRMDINSGVYYVPLALVSTIRIYGYGGNDTINLANFSRSASIYGGDGDDQLTGGSGHDRIFGGLGEDIIDGLAGNDTIYGDAGDDQIVGGSGNDLLFGGAGYDLIDGGAGDDYIEADEGDDTILGGSGNDYLDGGTGYDEINAADGEEDTVRSDGDDLVVDNTLVGAIDVIVV